MVAYGVIDGIKESGFTIPGDYSVCGFDNIYPSAFNGVALTSVEHFIVQGGKSALRLLCEKMEGRQSRALARGAVIRVEYQTRLIVRASSGKPRQV